MIAYPLLRWQQTGPKEWQAHRTWPHDMTFTIERDPDRPRKWRVTMYRPVGITGSMTSADYANTLLSARGLAARMLASHIRRNV